MCSNLSAYSGNSATSNLSAPTRGWGKEPKPTDTTLSDDIERIRLLRNGVFAHISRAKLTDDEYKQYWGQLMDVCRRCTNDNRLKQFGHDYNQQLTELENCTWTEKKVKDTVEGTFTRFQFFMEG